MVDDATLGVEVSLRNMSTVAQTLEFSFTGGASRVERIGLETEIENEWQVDPLTVWNWDSHRLSPGTAPRWILAHSDQRVFGFGFDPSVSTDRERPLEWAVGWKLLQLDEELGEQQGDSQVQADVRLDGDRYQVTLRLRLPSQAARTLRIGTTFGETLDADLNQLDRWLDSAAPLSAQRQSSPVSWQSSLGAWDDYLLEQDRLTRRVLRDHPWLAENPESAAFWRGEAASDLDYRHALLIGRNLLWHDSQLSQAWITTWTRQVLEVNRWEGQYRATGGVLPTDSPHAAGLGLASLAWRHYLLHHDRAALAELASELEELVEWQRNHRARAQSPNPATAINPEHDMRPVLWAEDMASMERIYRVLGDDERGDRFEDTLRSFATSLPAQTPQQTASGDRAVPTNDSRLSPWFQSWVDSHPLDIRGLTELMVMPAYLEWRRADRPHEATERWLWSSLLYPELVADHPDRLTALFHSEANWVNCYSGPAALGLPMLGYGPVRQRLHERVSDRELILWNNLDWGIERLAGLVLRSDGSVWFAPAPSALSWSRFTIPDFRGKPLEVQWRYSGSALPEIRTPGKPSAQTPPPDDLPPGARILWGQQVIYSTSEFRPEHAHQLFPPLGIE